MSNHDLIDAVESFLTSLDTECFQLGEKQDTARLKLLAQLKTEKSNKNHYLNAHTYPQYECVKCSSLTQHLQDLLSNPPGLKGIKVDGIHIGNKYVDYGWVEAIKRVISLRLNEGVLNEGVPTHEHSKFSPYSETLT